jgi:hypothetical protein
MNASTWKAAFWTGVAAFIGIFIPALFGWLTALQDAVNTGRSVPDPSALGSAAISGLAALVIALVTAVLVELRKQNWFPGTPPAYELPGESPQGMDEFPSDQPIPGP